MYFVYFIYDVKVCTGRCVIRRFIVFTHFSIFLSSSSEDKVLYIHIKCKVMWNKAATDCAIAPNENRTLLFYRTMQGATLHYFVCKFNVSASNQKKKDESKYKTTPTLTIKGAQRIKQGEKQANWKAFSLFFFYLNI